jgi:hypothetical protein
MNNLSHAELSESFSLADKHNTDTEKLLAFLDTHFALSEGSHRNVSQYRVYFGRLLAHLSTGQCVGLVNSSAFVDFGGDRECPSLICLSYERKTIELRF